MIDNKKIRESVGLTYAALGADPAAWFRLASSFHAAAVVLNKYAGQIPSDTRPFALNAALSLELLFKAILAKQKKPIPANSHDLTSLCSRVGVEISTNQTITLELMTEELVWAGRYPTPKSVGRFDQFHDVLLEKHTMRSQRGNVFTTRANPHTFPSFENYENIWAKGLTVFQEIHI
jgi:hypothetical protein